MESVIRNASTIRSILASQGDLSLWEVRAILSETGTACNRPSSGWLPGDEIVYDLKAQGLCVTLAGAARGGGKA